jgi:hypothetical protein
MHHLPLKAGVGGLHKECKLVGCGRYQELRRVFKAWTMMKEHLESANEYVEK